eukprot:12176049-Alexandrium_andersonii.AAC.1
MGNRGPSNQEEHGNSESLNQEPTRRSDSEGRLRVSFAAEGMRGLPATERSIYHIERRCTRTQSEVLGLVQLCDVSCQGNAML